MDDVGLAGGAHLAVVVLDTEIPGFADEADVIAGAIGLDVAQKSFETLADCALSVFGGRDRNRLWTRLAGGGKIGRNGLADGRHTSL